MATMPQNQSQSARTRNMGNKRCVRATTNISNEYDKKLTKLSISLDMSKSKLMDILLRATLDAPDFINSLQDRYNKLPEYRINPIIIDGKVHY